MLSRFRPEFNQNPQVHFTIQNI